jgi:hypothetical protein
MREKIFVFYDCPLRPIHESIASRTSREEATVYNLTAEETVREAASKCPCSKHIFLLAVGTKEDTRIILAARS